MQSFWKILGLIPILSDLKKRKDLIMKQTVEEAEKEYCDKNYLNIRLMVENAFEAGADWQSKQSPWISVEERLPEKPEYDWVLVIVRDKRDGFIGIPQIGELRSDGFWHTVTSDSFNTPDFMRIYNTTDVLGEILKQEVVAWMPIPSFDEILEANKDVLKRIKEKEVDHG